MLKVLVGSEEHVENAACAAQQLLPVCFGMPFGELRLDSHVNDGVYLCAPGPERLPPVMLSRLVITLA